MIEYTLPDPYNPLDAIHITPHGYANHFVTAWAKTQLAKRLIDICCRPGQHYLSIEEGQSIRNQQPSFQHLIDLATLIQLSRGRKI